MVELPEIAQELVLALDRLTKAGTAVWLQGAGSPGYIYCFIGDERFDFRVYVDADIVGSPAGEVDAVSVVFRNMHCLFVQPAITSPRLLDLLRSAKEDNELFRSLQRRCLARAVSCLRGMT